MIEYARLPKHFTMPKDFKKIVKLPRKLKKKVKAYCGIHWNPSSVGESYWHALEYLNPDHKRFLIWCIINELFV